MINSRAPFSFPRSLKCLVNWTRNDVNQESFPPQLFIPADIVLEIANYLVLPVDLLSFCVTSRHIYTTLLPKVYRDVELNSTEQCRATLGFLLRRPNVSCFIRKLVLRPNRLKAPTSRGLLEEEWISGAVERLASNLPALHTFIWDGLEMPHDRLWLTLRTFCPMLKTVGSSVGFRALNPDSHLYNFSGLLSFSLTPKNHHCRCTGPIEEFPKRLWEMLLEHCPQLEELSLGGVAPSWSRFFDVRAVTNGHWPSLRSLTLGYIMIEHDFETMLSSFLATHTALQKLAIHHEGNYYYKPLRLPHSALPCLVELSGPASYLSDLPGRHLIDNLSLTSYYHPATFLPSVCTLLRMLTSLKSLSIWIDLSWDKPNPGTHGKSLRFILESCPLLSHFEVICSSKSRFTFGIEELSIAVRGSPQLRTVTVTKRSQRFSDSDLVQDVAELLRENRGLQRVTVNLAPDTWCSGNTPELKCSGTYETIVGSSETPTSLTIRECRNGFFGRVSRRYICNL